MLRDEVIKFIKENKERFKKEYGVKEIYLFGSVARGEEREDSDIDLLVEFDEAPMNFYRFFGLRDEFENRFKKRVDLLEKEAIKERLKEYIFRDIYAR
jgi:predicted nucleotidyltransferase